MQSVSGLREKFERHAKARSLRSALEITDQGVVLGADTILLPVDEDGENHMSNDADLRLLALLGVAYKRRLESDVIANVRKASLQWASGNKSLARIHLPLAT